VHAGVAVTGRFPDRHIDSIAGYGVFKDAKRVKAIHPEALVKGVETPINPGPFALSAVAEKYRAP